MPSRVAASLAAAVMLCGCPDPNTYGTPRTLAPGDLQMQVSMEGYGGTAQGSTQFATGLPSFGVRYGVADRVDVGARVTNLTGLGADAKINLLRGRFDMAVDPGVQGYNLPAGPLAEVAHNDIAVLQLHFPLLLGVNLDEDTTLVLTPGFVATLASATAAGGNGTTAQVASSTTGAGARFGIGVNVRTSDQFSWQPEVTAWHEFNNVESWIYVFGLGINVGSQPDYSDVGGGAAR